MKKLLFLLLFISAFNAKAQTQADTVGSYLFLSGQKFQAAMNCHIAAGIAGGVTGIALAVTTDQTSRTSIGVLGGLTCIILEVSAIANYYDGVKNLKKAGATMHPALFKYINKVSLAPPTRGSWVGLAYNF